MAEKITIHDVVILGSGISGLTAAVYTARANLNPLVISGYEEGGQLTLTTDVENFPGFEHGIMGPELVKQTRKQAQRFGTKFKFDRVINITQVENKEQIKELTGSNYSQPLQKLDLESEETVYAKTVIVATGASARWLNLESENQFKGKGITTCATCDGAFYKDKEVVVIGGGDSAMEEATFLTKFASKVTLIHRREEFRASKIMQDRVKKNDKIEIVYNKQIVEYKGSDKELQSVMLENTQTKERSEFKTDGVFLAIGHIPNTTFVKDILELDDHGYIKADRFMHTNKVGIFAAGDVQDTRYRQAITAAGSGCQAALEAERFLAEHEE